MDNKQVIWGQVKVWAHAIRLEQWTKNGVVMMAWLFSVADVTQKTLERGALSFLAAVAMAFSFALVSSSFYLLNDVSDYDADRQHPVKRLRPIASRQIRRITAVRVALVLFACGFLFPSLAVMLHPELTIAFGTMLAYTLMQCLYTGFLKKIPYVDVVTLATGFVLRAIAGAAIIKAYLSPWLIVCTFTLAMFLAFCKRKNEIDVAVGSREVLRHYHPRSLAACIILAGALSVGEYLVYTLTSAMGRRLPWLWVTTLFVLAGIVRYTWMTWHFKDVGRPERALLTDRILWWIFAGYGLTALFALFVRI